jgi:hypothetical protein
VARSASARVAVTADSDFAEIIAWYEDLLEQAYPPTDLAWEPIRIGPTWQYDNGWVLPEFTLGWRVLAWCGVWLRDKTGKPWQFTAEQTRFVLWFFALDPETNDFLYHSAVLQRLKGWGKDPLAAALSVASMFAEVAFDHWHNGTPVGRDEPAAWVQIVAVTQVQTQNTMKLFPSLIPADTRKFYDIGVGKLNVWGLGDTRHIQAVTNNPDAIEGPRPTLVIRNETQNWKATNGGVAMAGAIEGNAAKSEDGSARMLDICNAYRPSEKSVGQATREAWDLTQGPDATSRDFGLLYDSLEAPPDAPLTADAAPGVIESIRGDSTWLSTRRILKSILNAANSASESRRKWYNQVGADDDARFDPLKVKACEVAERLTDGDEIVLFGDGSKSGDASVLVACRMPDGLVQLLHIQQPRKGQIVDRAKFSLAVAEAFEKYKPIAYWFDPSHAKDDEAVEKDSFWMPQCDEWAQTYGARLKFWAVKSGDGKHAVAWDMSSSARQAMFVPEVDRLDTDMATAAFRFAASTPLRLHLINAKENPGKYGVSLRKDNRSSVKKIDAAVATVGARMLWRLVVLSRVGTRERTGEAFFR